MILKVTSRNNSIFLDIDTEENTVGEAENPEYPYETSHIFTTNGIVVEKIIIKKWYLYVLGLNGWGVFRVEDTGFYEYEAAFKNMRINMSAYPDRVFQLRYE